MVSSAAPIAAGIINESPSYQSEATVTSVSPNVNAGATVGLNQINTEQKHNNENSNNSLVVKGNFKPKNNKYRRRNILLIIIVLLFMVILFLIAIGLGLGLIGGLKNNAAKLESASVLSILPPFQTNEPVTADVTVKVTNGSSNTKSYEGTVNYNEKGEIGVKLISNIAKVNDLISYLAKKSSNTSNADVASEYFNYNYSALAGYDSILYDPGLSFFGNNIQKAKTAQTENTTNQGSVYVKSSDCQKSISSLETAVSDTALSNKNLKPEISKENKYIGVTFDTQAINIANEKLFAFFGKCIDTNKPSLVEYKNMVENYKMHRPGLPTVKYLETGKGRWELLIINNNNQQTEIYVSNIKKSDKKSFDAKPYSRIVNQYGLAYDYCRIPPTVTSDFMASMSYKFIADESSYAYPSEFDSGYYCAPSEAKGYNPPVNMTLVFPEFTAKFNTTTSIDNLITITELRRYAEKYFTNKSYYPSLSNIRTENRDILDKNKTVRTMIDGGTVKYELLPKGCIDNCKDYWLTYKIANNVTIDSYSYNHPKANQ